MEVVVVEDFQEHNILSFSQYLFDDAEKSLDLSSC